MACLRCTCPRFRARYKRLVNNIYPADPSEGLIKNNMEKLLFYALSHHQKLDRIAKYMYQRLCRDLYRNRTRYACITVAAMDRLLMACHAPSLNLFIGSFLKMIEKLLESQDVELQVLGTNSFVAFSNIEEDTASYHRKYDFFISKFSSMCWDTNNNEEIRNKKRLAGVRGLQGVVRKTVSDDLQVDIWDSAHMNKIIPSLLFIVQDHLSDSYLERADEQFSLPVGEDSSPGKLAEFCLRELLARTNYANVKAVLTPLLTHLDNCELWLPNAFAIQCFKLVLCSVQSQHSYVAIEVLLNHLNDISKHNPKIKTSLLEALGEAIAIAAGGAIGSSIFEVFNTLLFHLKSSVAVFSNQYRRKDIPSFPPEDEKKFQEAVTNVVGAFGATLPAYQKIEVMTFITCKIPTVSEVYDDNISIDSNEYFLQSKYLQCLVKISEGLKTSNLSSVFPRSLLEPLLRLSRSSDSGVRLKVQKVFHRLLDRHENLPRLTPSRILLPKSEWDLNVEKCSHQDLMFMKRAGVDLFNNIFESFQDRDNKPDNIFALYRTSALILIEVNSSDIIIEFIRIAMTLQNFATRNNGMTSASCVAAIHSVVLAIFHLIAHLQLLQALEKLIAKTITLRQEEAKHLLPMKTFIAHAQKRSDDDSRPINHKHLVDINGVIEALNIDGFDTEKISRRHVSELITFSKMKSAILDIDEKNYDNNSIAIEKFKAMTIEDIIHNADEKTTRLQKMLVLLKELSTHYTCQVPNIQEANYPMGFVY
ncbi:Protein EFR3-like protein B [Trichoplax sp. H2]|nr:Protein EFR3-like protein B [Trichoplax sp. H2]|eukprot:RDD41311.1 Protein EFR3-like protein B [Trichoplax sp. H2]